MLPLMQPDIPAHFWQLFGIDIFEYRDNKYPVIMAITQNFQALDVADCILHQ